MSFFENLGIDAGYILLGALGAILFLLILVIMLMVKQGNLNKKYKAFMMGATGENLESAMIERFAEVDEIKSSISKMLVHLEKIDEVLLTTYKKVGIVKYDAFKEMGGKLSFALAMLTDSNDGFVINSMHSSREGCYTYVKEIIKGESFVLLAEEEKEALKQAIKCHDYTR